MVRKTFSTTIDAPREKVWEVLWSDAGYREWTAPFSPGSRAITDWEKGSKVLFVNEKGAGMVAEIADNRPNEFMSIRHKGVVNEQGEELYDDHEHKDWAGAMENYTLRTVNGQTELLVEMDLTEKYADYFTDTWPVALGKVKELAEK